MRCRCAALLVLCCWSSSVTAQPYGAPDRESPGDEMIQHYLAQQAERLDEAFHQDLADAEAWKAKQDEYRQQYLYMLGLWPLPERTPLHATVTGTYEGDGFLVDKLHFQSRPGLYVTANLYRPAQIEPDAKLPTVLYVCGHAHRGRNGNKTAYQSHGIWLARHGYLCLMLDTLQLGEIAAIHHGTYREQRWWWHSRGYTSAGVECWNGIRAIDYLTQRADVDSERIAVTGISGGGAATFWIAAADPRIQVAVPVSGMADLTSYVSNRVINGHCDCMFLHNAFAWPWTRIAALIAPRPLLFVNSDQDAIFPMDANDRVINRLERVYSLYGAGDQVDSLVSIGGHAYRQDIRQAAFRFLNIHLKQDPRPVTDSEIDLVTGSRGDREHPIPPAELRVFATEDDLPTDERNTVIDQHFVPLGVPGLPKPDQYAGWKQALVDQLRQVTFGQLPQPVPPARSVSVDEAGRRVLLETESPVRVPLVRHRAAENQAPARLVLWIAATSSDEAQGQAEKLLEPNDQIWILEPRGIGATRWTQKNPPNYVERAHVLLGQTVDSGRVRDILATVGWLQEQQPSNSQLVVAGSGSAAVLAAYAALLEPEIDGVLLHAPPATHAEANAPQFLNVLRVCDVPHACGMLAPRPLTLVGVRDADWKTAQTIYQRAGAADRIRLLP